MWIRHAGTLLPLFLLVMFVLALEAALQGELTWERPATYGLTAFSLVFGVTALVKMVRNPAGVHPSFFLLTLLYQKASLLLIYLAIFAQGLKLVYPRTPFAVPDPIIFALLVSASCAVIVANLLLFFGRKRGWLEAPVDPIPGGAFRPDVRADIRRIAKKQDDHIELTEQRFVDAKEHAEEVKRRLDSAAEEMDEKLAAAVEERESMQEKLDTILDLIRGGEEDLSGR